MNKELSLQQRFVDLLDRHVPRLIIRGRKAIGLCPLHSDRTPSFTADLEKLVWYCFPCARGGGVKDLALALGEPWGITRYSPRERARFATQARRRRAEERARAILQQRKDEREQALWTAWFEVNAQVEHGAYLLGLFFCRPYLADEFSVLAARTDKEYGEALSKRAFLEAQLAGEVE